MPPIKEPYPLEDLHDKGPDPLGMILSGASIAVVLGNAALAYLMFYRAGIDGWKFVAESVLMFLPNVVSGLGISLAILAVTLAYFSSKRA